MEWSYSLNSIAEIATLFWKNVGDTRVFAFHGEMGAGKTTFVHALCEVKGVQDVVGSPTFSIINEYVLLQNGKQVPLYHIDLYRLKSEAEAVQAGVEDCLYSDHICLVEWPDRAPGIFPPETMHIYLSVIDSTTRKLRIGGN